jgi:MarR family transcriptional regulator, lower aerobic nicotinate degradation pathway regulator
MIARMSTSEPDRSLPAPLLDFPSFLMVQVLREARRIAGEVGDLGLRLPHVTVLACLAEFGPCSQKEISERLRIDASDLVALLDDLERRELATRQRDARDRRRYTVTLTPAGTDVLAPRLAAAGALNDKLLEPLDAAERAELHRLLLRVFAHHEPRRVPAAALDRVSRAAR